MKPQKIRALLIENQKTQRSIAGKLGVTPGAVNRVIDGHFVSHRIREAIAEEAGVAFVKMWGKAA